MLDEMLAESGQKIDLVIEFQLDDEILVERVEGRRIHPPSGRSYHIKFNPPKVEGKDDVTGEDLIQRPDDNAEALKSRLANYHKDTTPISDHYKQKDVLFQVDASKKPAEVEENISKGLEKLWVNDSSFILLVKSDVSKWENYEIRIVEKSIKLSKFLIVFKYNNMQSIVLKIDNRVLKKKNLE